MKMLSAAQLADNEMNVKDVWFDSYDEEGTLRSLAWTESLVTKQRQRL